MNNRHLLAAVMAASIGLAGCTDPSPDEPSADAPQSLDIGAGSEGDATAMAASRSIAENVATSPTHKMLYGTLQAAELIERLGGEGEFTLFAPTDAAFVQVPPVTRDGWMRPAQKPVLQAILSHHIVPGRIDAAELGKLVDAGGGTATLKTIDGRDLTVRRSGAGFILTSGSGNKAAVTEADLVQKNGVVHVVDAVLVPAM